MGQRGTYQFPFSRYPAVRIVLFFIGGILTAYYYQPSLLISGIAFLVCIFLFMLFEWRSSRIVSSRFSNLSTLLFMFILFLFGAFRMSIYSGQAPSQTRALIEVSDWEKITVSGSIQSISITSSGKERWDVHIDSSRFDGIVSDQPFKARVLADEAAGKAILGDAVIFSGTIIPISEKRNPKQFDYKAYLDSQNISAQLQIDSLISITPNTQITEWIWWREQALSLVELNFDSQTAPIAKALLVGYKLDLDSESKSAFARAGLSHIMAVSGLHVGFIVAPFWIIIPYFWTKKHGSIIGLSILVIILFCYAGITGFSPSVLRASVMAFFLSYGKLFHKVNNSINLTAAAAICLLMVNPAQLFDIGFQLSFSAVLIILLILPVIQNKLPYWIRTRWYGTPIMVVIVSLVVQFGLYPLQAYYFGEISLVSPIANALFVPLLGIVVPLSLIALFLSAILPILGFIVNYPSLLFLGWMNDFVNLAATWSWAWTTASLNSSLIFILWLFLVLGISSSQISALRWKLFIGFLSTTCFILSLNLLQQLKPAKLTVTFFDVGQGDAALLQTPNNNHILIDAGVWSPGYNSGKSIILPHLQSAGIDKLDAIILSHPHADHIGGIIDLINEIPVDVIYNSGYEYESNLYQSYMELASIKSIPVKTLTSGDTLNLDAAMLFLVLGPDGNVYNSDPNEHSVVLNVIYGESEFLFTGDAGEEQEERLIHTYQNLLDTDLLKVGHHGSRTSSSIPFLNIVTPEIAIVSLAERNRFRHPHKEALSRLHQTQSELLFTSLEKAIIFESDGTSIQRIDW